MNLPLDHSALAAAEAPGGPFHPETIARYREHTRPRSKHPYPENRFAVDRLRPRPPCPADDPRALPSTPCTCAPDPDDLAEVWAGRARMARARADVGLSLTALDRQAIALADVLDRQALDVADVEPADLGPPALDLTALGPLTLDLTALAAPAGTDTAGGAAA